MENTTNKLITAHVSVQADQMCDIIFALNSTWFGCIVID